LAKLWLSGLIMAKSSFHLVPPTFCERFSHHDLARPSAEIAQRRDQTWRANKSWGQSKQYPKNGRDFTSEDPG
jgi:hypothetical protein